MSPKEVKNREKIKCVQNTLNRFKKQKTNIKAVDLKQYI